VEPGAAFVASAFELELPAGAASLHLEHADGSRERVADWTVPGTPLSQPRLLVDGSMVEVFPGTPTTLTTRAYPGVGSRWRVDTEAPSPVPGHLLARPAAEPV
ncbi:MAG: GH32 C-terminal domain-containing protein, partial [Nocardioidaceae bacterium]